jgi:hypothetical protein
MTWSLTNQGSCEVLVGISIFNKHPIWCIQVLELLFYLSPCLSAVLLFLVSFLYVGITELTQSTF